MEKHKFLTRILSIKNPLNQLTQRAYFLTGSLDYFPAAYRSATLSQLITLKKAEM